MHEDGFCHEDRYQPSGVLPTLVKSLAAGTQAEWVETLAALVQGEADKVIVGTTGGLRQALEVGTVTERSVEILREEMAKAFGSKGELRNLSGPAEAEMECVAVQYCSAKVLPTSRPQFGGGKRRIGNVGMLSGGGMSSQLAYESRAPDGTPSEGGKAEFKSIQTDLLGAIDGIRSGELVSGLRAFEQRLWAQLKHADLPKLSGTFVCVELVGSIGKEAGIGDRLVPKREAVQALAQHMTSMQLMAAKDLKVSMQGDEHNPTHTAQSVAWFQEARAPLTLAALALLDQFSSAGKSCSV
jgi:hypothetical protein